MNKEEEIKRELRIAVINAILIVIMLISVFVLFIEAINCDGKFVRGIFWNECIEELPCKQ